MFLDSHLNNEPGFTNDFNNNNNDNVPSSSSSGSTDGNSGQSSSSNDLEIDIDVEDPIGRRNIQTIDVTVSDEDTQKRIANADTDVKVFYSADFDIGGSDQTNSDGIATFEFEIGPPL